MESAERSIRVTCGEVAPANGEVASDMVAGWLDLWLIVLPVWDGASARLWRGRLQDHDRGRRKAGVRPSAARPFEAARKHARRTELVVSRSPCARCALGPACAGCPVAQKGAGPGP